MFRIDYSGIKLMLQAMGIGEGISYYTFRSR
jgi:hypothetical protein